MAGFSAAMFVVLVAVGAFVYWRVEYAIDSGLDTELDQATVTIAGSVYPGPSVPSERAAEATGVAWQVLNTAGTVVAHGGPAPAQAMISASQLSKVGDTARVTDIGRLLPASAQPYRVHATRLPGGGGFLIVAVRRDHRDEALRELLAQLVLAGLAALVAAALVGNRVARAALNPVERYRSRAAEIAHGASGVRLDIPHDRDDEVTRLGVTLNEMLGALEASLDQQHRFVHEASHELRTPLTLLKSRLQLARRRSRSVVEHEQVLDDLTVDVARLVDLVDQLLALGNASPRSGAPALGNADPTQLAVADVADVVGAVVARHAHATEDPSSRINLDVDLPPMAPGASLTSGSPRLPLVVGLPTWELDRLVSNLLRNGEVHGRGPISVRVDTDPETPGWVRLAVADAGPGMPAELLKTATDRFTRAPQARALPGSGLGLSLVRAIVHQAGGELRLCYDGHHVSHGQPVALPCQDHSGQMSVTVLLPRSPSVTSVVG